MSPSPMGGGRTHHGFMIAAAASFVVLLGVLFVVNNQSASDDAAGEAAPSGTPSSPPAPTEPPPAKPRVSPKPVRLSDGGVQVDGHVLTLASRVSDDQIDIGVSRFNGKPLTGPWELDLSKLRIDHTPTQVVFTLSFAELNIREGWQNDSFWILVDSKENPPSFPAADREVDFSVMPKSFDGAVYHHRGDLFGAIKDCKFEASLDKARDSVTVNTPRHCFDFPDRLRARLFYQAPRYGWVGNDRTGWTQFAVLGGSATIRDPARPWSQTP